MLTPLVVAVDGPSGSGKSSTARGVAQRLGLAYLDTGAMYRAMTWALLQRGVDLSDPAAIAEAAADVRVIAGTDAENPTISADGHDVSGPIRSDEVTSNVSLVAAVPQVRHLLVDMQRATIASSHGIVVEGRDIGTTVAPAAPVKVFLVADVAARAARRTAEVGGSDAAATRDALALRDQIDSTRTASPLTKPGDAIEVDSTFMTLDEVVDTIVRLVREQS